MFAESLWIELNNSKYKIIVGIIYRKPNTDLDQFQNSLLSVLDNLSADKSNVILVGDFNVNLLQTCIDGKAVELLTSLESTGLHQIITSPTRVTRDSSSLIDHIYTNISKYKMHSGIIETDISDHFPVFVAFENFSCISKNGPNKRITRSYRYYDAASFCEDLSKVDWKKVYRCSDVDIAYLTFYHFLKDACDKHAPIQNITIGKRKNSPRKPWVTSSIVRSINKKQIVQGIQGIKF